MGGRDYTTFVSASANDSPINMIDVVDPDGMIIASISPTGGSYGGSAVISLAPATPTIGVGFNITASFTMPPPYVPRLFVEFASGTQEFFFGQAASMYTYIYDVLPADGGESFVRDEEDIVVVAKVVVVDEGETDDKVDGGMTGHDLPDMARQRFLGDARDWKDQGPVLVHNIKVGLVMEPAELDNRSPVVRAEFWIGQTNQHGRTS